MSVGAGVDPGKVHNAFLTNVSGVKKKKHRLPFHWKKNGTPGAEISFSTAFSLIV